MSKTGVLKAWLGIAIGLVAAIGGAMRATAADRPGASARANACDEDPDAPQQRVLTPGPFNGNWNVTADDGTTFAVNLHQIAGGVRNTVTATATSAPLKIVRGYTANKTSVHLSVSASGQKGDMVLTLAPDGKSFAGTGQLADGTPINWSGRRTRSGAIAATSPQTRQAYAPSPQTRRTRASPQQAESSDDMPAQTGQTDAQTPQAESTDDAPSPQVQQTYPPAEQAEPADDTSSAAYPSADMPSSQPDQKQPQRPLSRDPFNGNWNVTADDGTSFVINFHRAKNDLRNKLLHEIAGGPQNNIAGTVTPPVLKIVSGAAMSKLYLHLTVSVSGQKGDMMLTLAPDGRSFSGSGQLADGTAISWSGQQASSAAQTRANDAPRQHGKLDRLRKTLSSPQDDEPASPASPGT